MRSATRSGQWLGVVLCAVFLGAMLPARAEQTAAQPANPNPPDKDYRPVNDVGFAQSSPGGTGTTSDNTSGTGSGTSVGTTISYTPCSIGG